MQARAVVRPVHVIRAAGADARDGQRLGIGRQRDRLTARNQRHDIRSVILAEGDIFARRRDDVIGGELARRVDALVLPRQVGADELAHRLAVLALVLQHEDAIVAGAELRRGGIARHEAGGAAGGGDAVHAGILRPTRAGEAAGTRAFEHDRLAIGREARAGIMAGLADHVARAAAVGADHTQPAEAIVGPADIDQALAVVRPAGEQLKAVVAARQAARGAAGDRLYPQFAQRFEHHLAAIGRDAGKARHGGGEAIGRDRDLRVRTIDQAARVIDGEGDLARVAAVGVDAADLALRPEDEARIVGQPCHVGVDTGDRPGFLHVLIEIVVDLALLARGEILYVEFRAGRLAADKGDLLAIRRRGGAHRAAGAGDGLRHLAAGEIVALDIEQVGIRILRIFEDRAGGDVARIEHRLAVGGVDRLAQFLLVRLVRALHQRHAGAARDVVHPHLAGAQ